MLKQCKNMTCAVAEKKRELQAGVKSQLQLHSSSANKLLIMWETERERETDREAETIQFFNNGVTFF